MWVSKLTLKGRYEQKTQAGRFAPEYHPPRGWRPFMGELPIERGAVCTGSTGSGTEWNTFLLKYSDLYMRIAQVDG